MKIRNGFVSNSSSTSFYILNNSKEVKTLVDFVKENPQLIENFKQTYNWYAENDRFTQEELLKSAEAVNREFPPEVPTVAVFGDEDGTLIGQVFDYILRDGGKSENFEWWFDEYLR